MCFLQTATFKACHSERSEEPAFQPPSTAEGRKNKAHGASRGPSHFNQASLEGSEEKFSSSHNHANPCHSERSEEGQGVREEHLPWSVEQSPHPKLASVQKAEERICCAFALSNL